MVAAIGRVRERDPSARVRLGGVAAFLIGSYKRQPDLVRVLIREVARSDQLDRQIAELRQAFDAIEAIVREGQETGSCAATSTRGSWRSASTARSRRS